MSKILELYIAFMMGQVSAVALIYLTYIRSQDQEIRQLKDDIKKSLVKVETELRKIREDKEARLEVGPPKPAKIYMEPPIEIVPVRPATVSNPEEEYEDTQLVPRKELK